MLGRLGDAGTASVAPVTVALGYVMVFPRTKSGW